MPVVNAESVPRPEAPEQLKPQVPGDYYQSIPSDPSSFGGLQATALEQAGAGAQRLGGGLFDIAIQRQELHNDVAAHNAVNYVQDESTKLLYGGDPNDPSSFGVLGVKGQGALTAIPAARDRLIKLYADARNSLENPYQQNTFDDKSRHNLGWQLAELGKHYDAQQQVAAKDANDAAYNNAKVTIASNLDNPAGFAAGAHDLMVSRLNELARIGNPNDPQQVENTLNQARADITVLQIDGMGARDPAGALDLLNEPENKALLLAHSPAQFYRLSESLQHQADQQIGTDLGRRAMGQGATARGAGAAAGPGFEGLWTRVKGREGGIGPGGEALVSPAGAIGISQIIPKTAQKVAADLNLPYDEKRLHTDQSYNETLGREYLRQQLETYGGNQMLAAAAYNAGPERVNQWISQFGDPRTGAISEAAFAAKIPINETRHYVTAVGAVGAPTVPMQAAAAGTQVAAATPTTTTDVPPGAPAPAAAPPPGVPLDQSTIDTLKAGGMSDEEIARVQSATTGSRAAPGAAAPAGAAPTPGAPAAGPPAMESRETRLSHIPPIGAVDPTTGRVVTAAQHDRAEAYVNSEYNRQNQRTEESRARLEDTLKNGAAMLADGKPFSYDEGEIRRLLPPEKADPIIEALGDAKLAGAAKTKVSGMTQPEIASEWGRLQSAVDTGPPTGYLQRRKEQIAFKNASQAHTEALLGDKADPAAYVAQNNPRIGQLHDAAVGGTDPQAHSDYAVASLAEQARLGVPAERQHVLSTTEAQTMAAAIGSDPEHAPDNMRALAARWGTAYPQVWNDIVTEGKLPAPYQVVGQLADYDQENAALLARTLGARAKDDAAVEKAIARKAPGGMSVKQTIADQVFASHPLQQYEQSLRDSNSSESQVQAIHAAVEHLAAGRVLYRQEDPSEATGKALDAVIGHYRFMPNGGGRVPTERYGDVSANTQAAQNGFSADSVTVPAVYGAGPTAPKPQEYIDAIRANTTWVTGPKADRLMALDHWGRLIRDRQGQPISVLFSQPGPPPTPMPPPGPIAQPF